jgi:hypothetical protein
MLPLQMVASQNRVSELTGRGDNSQIMHHEQRMAFIWSAVFRRRAGLYRSEPRRLKVLKLRSGERGGVSPLIFLVPTFVSDFSGNGQ